MIEGIFKQKWLNEWMAQHFPPLPNPQRVEFKELAVAIATTHPEQLTVSQETPAKMVFIWIGSPMQSLWFSPEQAHAIGRELMQRAEAMGYEHSRLLLPDNFTP